MHEWSGYNFGIEVSDIMHDEKLLMELLYYSLLGGGSLVAQKGIRGILEVHYKFIYQSFTHSLFQTADVTSSTELRVKFMEFFQIFMCAPTAPLMLHYLGALVFRTSAS